MWYGCAFSWKGEGKRNSDFLENVLVGRNPLVDFEESEMWNKLGLLYCNIMAHCCVLQLEFSQFFSIYKHTF